jgi:hypothetical protein
VSYSKPQEKTQKETNLEELRSSPSHLVQHLVEISGFMRKAHDGASLPRMVAKNGKMDGKIIEDGVLYSWKNMSKMMEEVGKMMEKDGNIMGQ